MTRVRESHSIERQVLDTLPITVYTVDLDGRITFLNRSWARVAHANDAPQLGDERAVVGAPIGDTIQEGTARARRERAMPTRREGRAPSLRWELSSGSPAEPRVFLVHV